MKENFKSKRILIIANSNLFFRQHLYKLFEELNSNTKIYFVTKKDPSFYFKSKNIMHIPLLINRDPTFKDIYSLILYLIIRIKINPDISLSFTPKASLINALTAIFPGKTIHYFTGQRWANYKGLKLFLFKAIDYFVIKMSNCTYSDSFSQSKFISEELNLKKPKVINYGSLSGVDLNKYTPKLINIEVSETNKEEIYKYLSLYGYNIVDIKSVSHIFKREDKKKGQ